ncbi:MAG: hypothetical protein COW00_19325 [Bdellovibrio sp. CG12_big_fil_rev_8_21_14_0_65_39_13]|nr:MAG: hypothetical protein COW78_01395 [Bdellovibrio sp. CG22_combo_CG10-13_8_21_14_all_39_27]PIQ57713.1 MAG: hypothetical protein COW00_19325 [Bdellovibrio sp. CG12_big_fil_rev_8_21_14_0_65_39_13]PIR36558.1 MAG: hypothetical protein COV37_02640 [Bdellovibrio sp. CG11_big_fil_rev_8_21_14_0_20_39_38]
MQKNEIEQLREVASKQSKGDSSEVIHQSLFEYSQKLILSDTVICDVGCGNGKILQLLRNKYPNQALNGMDFAEFFDYKQSNIHFLQADFNKEFPTQYQEQFDLVISSEVIEHMENPRHFIRQLASITKKNGSILLSTPNIESFLSVITFAFKGYHAAFGPTNYPAHITPISSYDLRHMVDEVQSLKLESLHYFNNGRIPGTGLMWQSLLSLFSGRLFSDNYFVVIKKLNE